MTIAPFRQIAVDLVLLSVDPRRDRIADPVALRYGLHGAELVILAAARRIELIAGGHVSVLSAEPTGDVLADRTLAGLTASRRQHGARWWVEVGRPEIVGDYLDRLAAAIRTERKLLHTMHYLTDPAAVAQARARLDAVTAARASYDLPAAALGGLARATRLDRALYPGRTYRSRHEELKEIGTRRWEEPFWSGPDAAIATMIAAVIRAVGGAQASSAAG